MKNKLKYLLLGAAFGIANISYGKDMVTVVDIPESGINVNYPGFRAHLKVLRLSNFLSVVSTPMDGCAHIWNFKKRDLTASWGK